jgi:hypothetical protein
VLVFIDESGDPGTKGKPGSSDYFVVTAVIFEDRDEAQLAICALTKFASSGLRRDRLSFISTRAAETSASVS